MHQHTLKVLLERMGVPEMTLTIDNIKWLGSNLVTYKDHPDFPEAIHLVAAILTIKGEDTTKIIGRD